MRKLGAVFWIGLVLASGFTTFKVKHAVQDIDDELNRTRKQVVAEQQEIRVLAAEWTYLNQPDRLVEFNRVFLQFGPMTARQMQQRIEDLPWRAPMPQPTAQPDMLLAAVPPAPSPPAPLSPASAPRTPPAVPANAAIAPAVAAATPVAAPVGAPPSAPVIAAATGGPAPRVRLAKATPASLDALIAQIAHAR